MMDLTFKTQTKNEGQYDVINCRVNYIGETRPKLSQSVIDHSGRGKYSHIFKHCEDFSIIGANYRKNKSRRKIAESLFINEKRSTLSTQDNSVSLELFN